MRILEILGDSIREDLNFVASKLGDLPSHKSVAFIGSSLNDITLLKQSPAFSKIEIDRENEARYKIHVKNFEIYFILSKNLEKFERFDYIFLIDLSVFNKAINLAREKVFLLTDRRYVSKELDEIRDENFKNLEIIQLGLPESWVEF